ncbi:MAG: hypothetical protein F4018_16095 [Acidobacteria bacterium]|nr:hypothetical protein [Acidobacteriota bacterium]MYH27728.1 hypothetical protein [Acidobacteriota bacterium]MYK89729.1 hypothetical protein [Acidobacteriota bacterium]
MKCDNCHAEIDWNAVRQCLCYRGPVLGATHRELNDEDWRTRRRIRERIRRDRDGAAGTAAA